MYEGKLMVKGWKEAACADMEQVLEDALRMRRHGPPLHEYRPRTACSPDRIYEGISRMKSMTALPIIASGGVSGADDLKRLKELDVWAAIVGKAFYEGRIGIQEAMVYAD